MFDFVWLLASNIFHKVGHLTVRNIKKVGRGTDPATLNGIGQPFFLSSPSYLLNNLSLPFNVASSVTFVPLELKTESFFANK